MMKRLVPLLLVPILAHSAEYHVAKTGSNGAAGTFADPFLTIQEALDTALISGDIVTVHTGSYTELTDTLLVTGLGIQPKAAGVTVRAATGESVVIDQGHILSIAGDGTATLPYTESIFGFIINGYDDVIIEGFEIINVSGGITAQAKNGAATGPSVDPADISERMIVRNNHVHDVWGNPGGNIGAVFLSTCWDCEIYDNTIHDVGILRDISGSIYPFCAGCDLPAGVTAEQSDAYRQNTAGIFSFEHQAADVHHNDIYNAGAGIFIKRPLTQPNLLLNDGNGRFHHNKIYDTIIGLRFSTYSNGPPHQYTKVDSNVIYSVNYGPMSAGISNDSSIANAANGELIGFNNTIIAKVGFSLAGFTDVRMFNNVIQNSTSAISMSASGTFPSVITVAERNLYAKPQFSIAGTLLTTMVAWQADDSGNCASSGGTCGDNSAEYSEVADIMFNPGLIDQQIYTLKSGSPALGFGRAVGVSDLPDGLAVDAGGYPDGAWSASNLGGDYVGVRSLVKSLPAPVSFVGL